MTGSQLRLFPSNQCGPCPLRRRCDEAATEHGCDDFYDPQADTQRDVLYPGRSDLAERFAEVRTFDTVITLDRALSPLPLLSAFIPAVEPRTGFHARSRSAVAIPVDRVRPTGPVTSATEMKVRLGLDRDAVLILTCFQHDDILERVWKHRRQFVQTAVEGGYDLILPPSFSLWRGDSPIERRYNNRRSIMMFESLADTGAATAPLVSWVSPGELHDWIGALRNFPEQRAFCLDWATVRSNAWSERIDGLRKLIEGVGEGYEVLVNGVAHPHRLLRLREICGHIHAITKKPFETAMSMQSTLVDCMVADSPITMRGKIARFQNECQTLDAVLGPLPDTCMASQPRSVAAPLPIR